MNAPVAELDQRHALALWNQLRQHFINAGQVIEDDLRSKQHEH